MTGVPGDSGRARLLLALLLTATIGACTDPTLVQDGVPKPDEPGAGGSGEMLSAGVYEFTVTGIGTENMTATATQIRDGAGNPVAPAGTQAVLGTVGAGLGFENMATNTFWEGSRTGGGQRYVSITYRVRNGTAGVLNNLTFVPNMTAGTIAGTPWTALTLYAGGSANTAIAQQIAPTGMVILNESGGLSSPFPDVLQVFTEAEIAAVPLPAGVTGFMPYGFVVRNRLDNTRNLPVQVDANDFRGILTFAFRFPLTPASTSDPFTFSFQATAIVDSETRMTESIEESQDTAAVRRLRERATMLGATTVTVLNGSSAMDPAVPDYPGQRQICSPRTSGTAASPTNTIVTPGAYTKIAFLYPGESLHSCTPYFRTGVPGRPATNIAFPVGLRAMDRYGNLKSTTEAIRLERVSGPLVTLGPATTFAGGIASINATYTDYGTSLLAAVGLRPRDTRTSSIFGVTRNWTAGAGTTDWHTGNNWAGGAVPMVQDSVYIPLSAPLDPVLAANVQVEGVHVEDIATISLNAFDLTATANVFAGLTGGITNTTGRLILAGTARTVQGRLPRLRVTGTYSLTGNVTSRAPLEVSAGRLTAAGFRMQAESN